MTGDNLEQRLLNVEETRDYTGRLMAAAKVNEYAIRSVREGKITLHEAKNIAVFGLRAQYVRNRGLLTWDELQVARGAHTIANHSPDHSGVLIAYEVVSYKGIGVGYIGLRIPLRKWQARGINYEGKAPYEPNEHPTGVMRSVGGIEKRL